MAAANGHENVVRMLVNSGVKVDLLNESKNTPLRICVSFPGTTKTHTQTDWAAFNGHGGIVKLLLEKGANPSIKNEFGRTPLDDAMSNEKDDIVVC